MQSTWLTSNPVAEYVKSLPFFRVGPKDRLPFCIGNRRIYILPTGFGLFVGIVLAVILLGALNYNNNAGLVLGFILISVVNNSLIMAHLSLLDLQINYAKPQSVHAGQMLKFEFKLSAHSRERTGKYQIEIASINELFSFDNTDSQVTLHLPTTQRGWMIVERAKISSLQPMGLARSWSYINLHSKILIYPEPKGNPHFPDLALNSGESGKSTQQITDQPHHLRNFRSGDSLKQIAWKASARTNELQVREYESSNADQLVFDWQSVKHLSYEARINQLCLWVLQAEKKQKHYALMLPNQFIASNHGDAHKHECLSALALLAYER